MEFPMRRNQITAAFVFTILPILAIGGFVAYYRSKAKEARAREIQSQALLDRQAEIINKFADKNGAIVHWRRSLVGKTFRDTIYSAELSQVLIRGDRRPILFIVKLKDVQESGEKFIAILEGRVNIHTHLRLVLEASAEQARALMAQPRGEQGKFAVVASVVRVSSSTETLSGPDGQSDERPVLIVEGHCVDTVFVGQYVGDTIEIFDTFPLSNSTPTN